MADAEVIVFPDVEETVRAYLEAALAARGQATEGYAGTTPTGFPDRSFAVRRTGGFSRNLVTDVAQVSIDCRATKETAAERLSALVRAMVNAAELDGWMGDVPVSSVNEIAGPYLNPDPINPKQHRYSATYQVAVRGTVL